MELEPSTNFRATPDRRPHMPEPPRVWLVAIDDVLLPMPAGCERALDGFYGGLLGFERDPAGPVYRAANVRLRFEVHEPPVAHPSLRPMQVLVPSLGQLVEKLIEAGIDYVHQQGLAPGHDCIALLDPAGNWVQVMQHVEFQ